jgi:hypothetical protein
MKSETPFRDFGLILNDCFFSAWLQAGPVPKNFGAWSRNASGGVLIKCLNCNRLHFSSRLSLELSREISVWLQAVLGAAMQINKKFQAPSTKFQINSKFKNSMT